MTEACERVDEHDAIGWRIDRRDFLIRSSVTVAAVSSWGGLGVADGATFARDVTLTPSVMAAFAALVGAVEEGICGVTAGPGMIDAAVTEFSRRFAFYDPGSQARFVLGLAVLEMAPATSTFSTLETGPRAAFLGAWQPYAPSSARALSGPGAVITPVTLLNRILSGFDLGVIEIPKSLALLIGPGAPSHGQDIAVAAAVRLAFQMEALGCAQDPAVITAQSPDADESDAADPRLWGSP